MKAAWNEVRLGEVAQVEFGFAFKSVAYTDQVDAPRLLRGDNIAQGSLRWNGCKRWPSDQCDGLERYRLAQGDVVLAMDRPWIDAGLKYATIGNDDLPALLVQRVARLRGTTSLDTQFLKYIIGSAAFTSYVLGIQTGTAVPHISGGQIREYRFGCPPVSEQRAVASILGALDDKIDLNRRMNETLEELARTIFKSWFVDFDPVRAKAEGRRPVGMDAETAALFPSRLVQSELGETPARWRAAPLAQWATALSGGTPSKSDPSLWGGDVPWISPKVMTEIHADEADAFVTSAALGNGTRIAPSGSTLVMVRGMGLHKQVRVSQARKDVSFNQDVKALVPKDVEPTLLLLALLDARPTLLGRVQSSGHGTGVLPSDILLDYALCFPSRDEQRSLAVTLDALNERIAAARSENRTLAELRDLLLPKLISGELRVPTAEKLVEAAL